MFFNSKQLHKSFRFSELHNQFVDLCMNSLDAFYIHRITVNLIKTIKWCHRYSNFYFFDFILNWQTIYCLSWSIVVSFICVLWTLPESLNYVTLRNLKFLCALIASLVNKFWPTGFVFLSYSMPWADSRGFCTAWECFTF